MLFVHEPFKLAELAGLTGFCLVLIKEAHYEKVIHVR